MHRRPSLSSRVLLRVDIIDATVKSWKSAYNRWESNSQITASNSSGIQGRDQNVGVRIDEDTTMNFSISREQTQL
jgi:hypothetical protein